MSFNEIDLTKKNTIWLKVEHDRYRGARIGMWQYYDTDGVTPLDLEELKIYVDDLKKELDTRENILNKREKTELRKQVSSRRRKNFNSYKSFKKG